MTPLLFSRIELGDITPHNLKQLKKLNSVVFPITYTDKVILYPLSSCPTSFSTFPCHLSPLSLPPSPSHPSLPLLPSLNKTCSIQWETLRKNFVLRFCPWCSMSEQSAKVFSAKIVIACIFHQFTKIFSLKSFPLYSTFVPPLPFLHLYISPFHLSCLSLQLDGLVSVCIFCVSDYTGD